MKQVVQSYRTGELELAEVPTPALTAGSVLVKTIRSVVSVGTERYMLELAKKSLLGKAVARPDLVRQVINKVHTEGLAEAYRQAMGRLDNPVPLGYSSSGLVLEVGSGVEGFVRGDRVACAGSGFASHAEIVRIPRNMLEKIPEGVDFEEAAFVTLGGIALHGIRLAEVTLGERIVVLGLGLLGLIAVQILKAAGCRVFGVDVDAGKVRLALELGADAGAEPGAGDLVQAVRNFSGGPGADAVIIFAATPGNEPIEQAAELARDRGRIVVPGLVGLDIPRKISYEKELSFRISRAWGPGLYDPNYEERGLDYPIGFVRWTARRNLAAFLELLATGRVKVAPLITHRFPLESAVDVYARLLGGKERFTGVLLTYPEETEVRSTIRLRDTREPGRGDAIGERPQPRGAPLEIVRIGCIGAGLFARGTLFPALKGIAGLDLRRLATSSGMSGRHVGRRYGFGSCSTSYSEILESPDIDLVMILTRHGSHARLAGEALRSGKHVFVEKPLALAEDQLCQVIDAHRAGSSQLMVGFNRRFAPVTREALRLLADIREPLVVSIRVNAGPLPRESWVNDPSDGGGPIVGEACHFVDLAQALTRSMPVRVHAVALPSSAAPVLPASNVLMTLEMANGSIATVAYTTGGDKGFARERVEAIGGGAVCVIENFKSMVFSRAGRTRRLGRAFSGVDRGYKEEMRLLVESLLRGGAFPVRFEEYVATTRATFAALESLRTGRPVELLHPS